MKNVFAQRIDGVVVGVFANFQAGYAEEAIPDDHPDVLAFHNPPPGVPSSVTPAQAKIALFEAGLLDDVEALVLNYPYRPVSIWWTSALSFNRDHAYLNAIGIELDLTDAQIDALFVVAANR